VRGQHQVGGGGGPGGGRGPPRGSRPGGPPHRAYEEAGLSGVDWIAPALAALDLGHDLPEPFDDLRRTWDRFFADRTIPHTLVDSPDGSRGGILKQAMAMPALFDAMETDPLRAALDALFAAAVTYGSDYPRLFDEARQRFTML
ncbi:hypothetical protein ACFV6W_09075, partial [Streptomyces sp. NPDC059802]